MREKSLKIVMSSMMILGFAFFSNEVRAGSVSWIECNSTGDALSGVNLALRNSGTKNYTVEVTANMPSGENPIRFTMNVEKTILEGQTKAGQIVILGRSSKSSDFGGAISEASLLTIDFKKQGGNNALLAMNGSVYQLTCHSVQ